MKKLIVIIILLFASVVTAGPSVRKIINWINNQNYNKTQLQQNLTWAKLEAAAENRGIDPNSIKPYWHTIENSVWSDWRQKRIEAARVILETKVHEYDPGGIVRYMGYECSSIDPNNMVSVFTVEVDLNLERN